MLIAVLSDIHDNIWNLEKVLPRLEEEGVEMVLFCGDFCAPFTLKMLSQFPGDVHCVLGNNDGDALLLSQVAQEAGNVTLYSALAELPLGGCQVAVTHYPHVGRALACSGLYDVVFSGHTHEQHVERVGDTLWVNPGEVMGRFGHPTYAIYDTETNQVRIDNIPA